jgi:ribosomal protein S18 acetylase RimI-like enzyme
VGAFEDDALRGVAAHYEMGNVVLCAPEVEDVGALVDQALRRSGRPFAGVVGPEAQVDAALADLGAEGAEFRCDEREILMQVRLEDLVVPPELAAGKLRGHRLRDADIPDVANWAADYHVEVIGHERTMDLRLRVEHGLEETLGTNETWVLENEAGELCAMSRFNAELPEAVQLGGVWTPEEFRSRGYARAVVASHLLAVGEAGVKAAVLFTGERNEAALRAYRALGFESVGRFRVAVLRQPQRISTGQGWI